MNIKMYLNDNKLENIIDSIEPCINSWLFQNNIDAEFVNVKTESRDKKISWCLGLKVKDDQMIWLPTIITFLHSTAMLHQLDYVIDLHCEESNLSDRIGLFGFISGKPNINKILESISAHLKIAHYNFQTV